MKRVTRQTPARAAGIVHLGLGAFSRAHIAIYTEDAITKDGGNWGIVGVSLRSPVIRDALVEQQYAYTAAQLDPKQTLCRQIEVVNNILVAPENPELVVQQMADTAIKIVSLTVTEKGYCLSPSTGTLDLQHADIQHDIVNSSKRAGHRPFTVLSCDNLPENGNVVRRVVLALADQICAELRQWIEENGRFPSTMVDRITPATTANDLETVQSVTGLYDAAPVVHEPFSQWVIEDDFVSDERPNWNKVGAELVSDVQPYELMKLRMLNGTHSALAYLGYLAGFKTIADTVADKDFRRLTETLWRNEIIPTVTAPEGVSLSEYADNLMARYTNPSIRHLTWQIAMDGSQKIPQRIIDVVNERRAVGAKTPGLILVIAAWLRYVGGIDETGATIDVRDPLAEKFANLAASVETSEDWVASILSLREIFPEKVAARLSMPVTQAYCELLEQGAQRMIRKVYELENN